MKINELFLELGPVIYKLLKGINTIDDLCSKTIYEIAEFPSVGPSCINFIRYKLTQISRALKDDNHRGPITREMLEGRAPSLQGSYFEEIWKVPIEEMPNINNKLSKKEWVAQQRKKFKPGKPEACYACGEYSETRDAHHIYPLYLQYNNGKPARHDHVWLCKRHHGLTHRRINQIVKNVRVDTAYTLVQEERMSQIDNYFKSLYIPH